jgi:hypothetical protein
MKTPDGRPVVRAALRSSKGGTEVTVQVRWQIPGPLATGLLIAAALILGAIAVAALAGGEATRDVLYGLVGFLAGARPRIQSRP